MDSDAQLIEASLVALADAGCDISDSLHARFLAAYPDRRAVFTNLAASSRRMTDETLQMIHGLAAGETWVGPLVNELTFTHRNYGSFPMCEYDDFIDMAVDEVRSASGGWNGETGAAWARHATRLKAIIAEAKREWTRVMPGQMRDPLAKPQKAG